MKDLNNRLVEFNRMVDLGFVMFSGEDLQRMPKDYNTDYQEWLNNGAAHFFIVKMTQPYKCLCNYI